jgi:hypothetical protein
LPQKSGQERARGQAIGQKVQTRDRAKPAIGGFFAVLYPAGACLDGVAAAFLSVYPWPPEGCPLRALEGSAKARSSGPWPPLLIRVDRASERQPGAFTRMLKLAEKASTYLAIGMGLLKGTHQTGNPPGAHFRQPEQQGNTEGIVSLRGPLAGPARTGAGGSTWCGRARGCEG